MVGSLRMRRPGLPLVTAALLLLGSGPLSAATFNVAPGDVAGLTAAINTANANGQSDTIDLGGGTFVLVVVNNVTDGPNGLPDVLPDGGSALTIRNGTIARAAAAPLFRLLHVGAGATLALGNVTLRDGSGGLSQGGAIYNLGTLSIAGSTLSGNASEDDGGALYNAGTVASVRNSTFSGNSGYRGGGVFNAGSIAALTNSTIASNAAGFTGGGIFNAQSGTIAALVSCIVAGNTAGDSNALDVDNGGALTTASNDLVGVGDGSGLTNGVNGNQVGSFATPLAPLLGPLASNGGPTATHALLAGSPAIDTGSNPAALANDQRGAPFARTAGGATDVGAFELQALADLGVTKTDAPDPVTAGTNLVWTITVANAGPDTATGVSLSDTLPAGTTFVSLASGAGWSCTTPAVGSGGSVSCTTAALAPGSAVLTLTVAVGPAVPAGTVLSNTATVTATSTDPNPANDGDTATTTVAAVADLSVTKTDGVTTVNAGGSTTYTIVAANAGPSTATGAVFTDAFPAALACTYTSVAAGGAAGNTASGAGNISNALTLPAGGSVTYTVACTVPAAAFGTISNTATIAAPAGVTDPNAANNAATDTDTVVTGAAVSGTKSVSGTYAVGGTVTYAIVLTNTGIGPQADAPGDELVDVLPATLALVSATASAGTAVADTTSNTVRWNGPIAAGASVTVTVTARVLAAAEGRTVSNQGTIAFDGNGDGANDSSALTDDPSLPGAADPTVFAVPGQAAAIPTLGPSGLLLMATLVAAAGLAVRWR